MLNDADWGAYVWFHTVFYCIKEVCTLALSASTVNTYKVNLLIFLIIEEKRWSGSPFHCAIVCCYHFVIKALNSAIVALLLRWEYFLHFNISLELFYNILALIIRLFISFFLTKLDFGLNILSISPSR